MNVRAIEEELTTMPSASQAHGRQGPFISGLRIVSKIGMAAATLATASFAVAPLAVADTNDNLRAAVASVRESTCGPTQVNPILDQAAAAINSTTDVWINHASRAVPETDALPILKDLGYGGTKATILSGAAKLDADAIKVLLLQGYATIPDCSYTDVGVSALYNAKKDMIFTTVLLAA